jgi:hypothetical protein
MSPRYITLMLFSISRSGAARCVSLSISSFSSSGGAVSRHGVAISISPEIKKWVEIDKFLSCAGYEIVKQQDDIDKDQLDSFDQKPVYFFCYSQKLKNKMLCN